MPSVKKLAVLFAGLLLVGAAVTLLAGCNRGQQVSDHDRINPLPESADIVFLSNTKAEPNRWEVYSMDDLGGSITRLTYTDQNHFLIAVDASGRYIVATRISGDDRDLWILDLETGEEALLVEKGPAEGAAFSPDGGWVLFWMATGEYGQADIYRIRRDGSGLVNITNTPQTSEFDPAWSSDGQKIAFNCYDPNLGRGVLKISDVDGGDPKTIYDPTDSVATELFPAGVYDPAWSPDDQWVLVTEPVKFTRPGENGQAGVWHILKIRSDGSEAFDLTGSGHLAESASYRPSFSPDGESILLTARYLTDSSRITVNLFTMDVDGTSVKQLTDTSLIEQMAVWVPAKN